MNHMDEGLLLAVRDGEPVDDFVHEHMRTCLSCRRTVTEAGNRAGEIEALLAAAADPVDVQAGKARVRARLDAERSRGERPVDRTRHIRRAAAILVVSAGAAYALPGSPLPGWLGLEDRAAPHDATIATEPVVDADGDQELLLVPAGNGIEVVVEGVPAGVDVELVWLDGSSARIAAGPGARYAIANGRATATGGEGPVRIGIPRIAPRISITINGRTVYEGTSEGGEARDVVSRSESGIVFLASQP